MPAPMDPAKVRSFVRYMETEPNMKVAAAKTGVSYAWARKYMAGTRTAGGPGSQRRLDISKKIARAEGLGRPLMRSEMCPEALRALDDFPYFRERYFGRVTSPWQAEFAVTVVQWLDSEHKEFGVVNCPPGTGKTTFLHDLAAWLTTRNRRLRGVFGSRTFSNAARQSKRLQRSFERSSPVMAKTDDLTAGMAIDAVGVLAADYGLFRPISNSDVWRADAFVVVQGDNIPVDEKEPTWSAVGQDTSFLGNRYDLILWDDVVDKTTVRTLEAVEAQRAWWEDEAETRLEPRGLLLLVGQRFASVDLYRFCLDKKIPVDDDNMDEVEAEEFEAHLADQPSQYHHVMYRIHAEEKCLKQHSTDSPAYPEGCLLEPRRVPWREVRRLKATKPRTYAIQYQQEDADPESVLVPRVYISGGRDPETGIEYPGCWDTERKLCELPKGLIGPLFSIATVDPSPTKWWAIQWWVYAPNAGKQAFLMDAIRVKMGGNDLLDWLANDDRWRGVMEEWQIRSQTILPITHWIIEDNAAQRFLLQFDHMRRWRSHHKVNVMPHQTTVRKLDPDLGVDMLRSWYEFGRTRLPGKDQAAKLASLKLVDELCRYPNAGSDDMVMANWFFTHNLDKIAYINKGQAVQRRPGAVTSLPRYRGLRSVG